MPATKQSLLTVEELIRRCARQLEKARLSYGHGTSNALDDAAWLVLETLGLPLDKPASLRKKLTAPAVAKVEKVIAARIETRKPAAYILRKAYIQGLPFYVDERVIVPRSFIGDLLYDGTLHALLSEAPRRVLDLCTGSGCLAVLTADVFPKATVDAVDLSPDALDVAARNVKDYKLGRRIKLFRGNLFAPVKSKKYDLIITNPPYVDAKAMKKLPQEYRHEPPMALGSGADGLDLVRKIIKEAPKHLTADGGLLCEVGRGRKLLEKAYPRLPFLWLDTELSEGEVFWLTRKQLLAA